MQVFEANKHRVQQKNNKKNDNIKNTTWQMSQAFTW